MNSLIDFYDYLCPNSFLYSFVKDEMHEEFDPHEYTLFGTLVYDFCEFEYLCDLSGCLDANL